LSIENMDAASLCFPFDRLRGRGDSAHDPAQPHVRRRGDDGLADPPRLRSGWIADDQRHGVGVVVVVL